MKPRVRRRLVKKFRSDKALDQGGLCALCGKPMGKDITADHIYPKCEGGKDILENMQAAHAQCNQDKGARLSPAIELNKWFFRKDCDGKKRLASR